MHAAVAASTPCRAATLPGRALYARTDRMATLLSVCIECTCCWVVVCYAVKPELQRCFVVRRPMC